VQVYVHAVERIEQDIFDDKEDEEVCLPPVNAYHFLLSSFVRYCISVVVDGEDGEDGIVWLLFVGVSIVDNAVVLHLKTKELDVDNASDGGNGTCSVCVLNIVSSTMSNEKALPFLL
jgi:hypothetical protein